ncbi:MAG: hypothetical protein P8189_11195 [Anaerolineae bacterium]
MTETKGQDLGEWSRQWRAARATVMAASGWILALPALARLMRESLSDRWLGRCGGTHI